MGRVDQKTDLMKAALLDELMLTSLKKEKLIARCLNRVLERVAREIQTSNAIQGDFVFHKNGEIPDKRQCQGRVTFEYAEESKTAQVVENFVLGSEQF